MPMGLLDLRMRMQMILSCLERALRSWDHLWQGAPFNLFARLLNYADTTHGERYSYFFMTPQLSENRVMRVTFTDI